MSRLSQGEREAFDPLFRALYPRALRFARIKLAEDQAADAAQSVMTKVFARASAFEPGKPVLPWFYAALANELRSMQRRTASQGQRTVTEMHAHRLRAADDPERLLLEQEMRSCLERAIASLDETSAEAIACMLDDRPLPRLDPSAFRKRVSRAYARLEGAAGRTPCKVSSPRRIEPHGTTTSWVDWRAPFGMPRWSRSRLRWSPGSSLGRRALVWVPAALLVITFTEWRGVFLMKGARRGVIAGFGSMLLPLSVLRPCCGVDAKAMGATCCIMPSACWAAGAVLGLGMALLLPRVPEGRRTEAALGMILGVISVAVPRCSMLFLGEGLGLLGGVVAGIVATSVVGVLLSGRRSFT
jgi:RNA polymerase sigma factor (sigma-70 family)